MACQDQNHSWYPDSRVQSNGRQAPDSQPKDEQHKIQLIFQDKTVYYSSHGRIQIQPLSGPVLPWLCHWQEFGNKCSPLQKSRFQSIGSSFGGSSIFKSADIFLYYWFTYTVCVSLHLCSCIQGRHRFHIQLLSPDFMHQMCWFHCSYSIVANSMRVLKWPSWKGIGTNSLKAEKYQLICIKLAANRLTLKC